VNDAGVVRVEHDSQPPGPRRTGEAPVAEVQAEEVGVLHAAAALAGKSVARPATSDERRATTTPVEDRAPRNPGTTRDLTVVETAGDEEQHLIDLRLRSHNERTFAAGSDRSYLE